MCPSDTETHVANSY